MRRRRSNTTSCAACANGWLVAVCPWERHGDAPRATDSAVLEDTGICSRRSSSILGQMCDRISQPDGLGIERPRWIDTRTVLMDGWITSSARPSSDGGIVSPSALAVFMLITNSKFVGCSTGRSAGLAPFRILSTKYAARRATSDWFAPYDMRQP